MRRDPGLKNFICALVNLMDAINVEPNMLQALLLGCLVYLFIYYYYYFLSYLFSLRTRTNRLVNMLLKTLFGKL
jgi:hypothetical protein